jgi:diguanylate cyclase
VLPRKFPGELSAEYALALPAHSVDTQTNKAKVKTEMLPVPSPFDAVFAVRFVAAGVIAYAAIMSLLMARYDRERRHLHWYFSAMCILSTAELLVRTRLDMADSVASAGRLFQWQYALILAVVASLFGFVAIYTEQARFKTWQLVVTAFSAFLIAVNFILTPYSLRYASLHPATPQQPPWGGTIDLYAGAPSAWNIVARVFLTAILLWAIARAYLLFRRGRHRAALFLTVGLVFLWLASMIGYLSDIGYIALPQPGAFGFLGLIVFMSVALGLEARDRNRALMTTAEDLQEQIAEVTRTRAHLRHMAYHDYVTGLPNRARLQELLSDCVMQRAQAGHKGALILLDLDDFRAINDVLGYNFGDRLLQAVATRLLELDHGGGHLAHLGGDEFVVLLPEAGPDVTAAALKAHWIAEQDMAALNTPFSIDGHSLTVSASAGIALFPDGNESHSELLQRASMALLCAKSYGRGSVQLYAADMQEAVRERLQLERGLRRGLERGEFIMHFQPQVDFSGAVVGAEALLRWQHPERGWVSPAQFLPIAEHSGLIVQIGDWVLQQACRQIKTWEQSLPAFTGHVSVNVSAWQFQQGDFREAVRRHLHTTGIDPSRLTLEITESAFLRDLDGAVDTIKALKSEGVDFSIDDFGTGYASLSYLGRLPVDELKIDQSFIRKLGTDVRGTHLVETIINIGRCLDLRVVAEGVESDSQKSALGALHCWAMQGYHFARSMTAEAFADWFTKYRRTMSH